MYKCKYCDIILKYKTDYANHLFKKHDIRLSKEEEKDFEVKKCKSIGCNNYVSANKKIARKSSGYCRSCVELGEKNPIHKADIEKLRKSCSEATKKLWLNDEYRNKVIKNATGIKRSEEFKKEQSKRVKEIYNKYPEQRKIRSDKMKESWLKGKIKQKHINRSKAEKDIFNGLVKIYGKKEVTRKCIRHNKNIYFPDIIIWGRVIIEYYGDYWHGNPKKYSENDLIKRKLVKDKWAEDEKRKTVLFNGGYYVYEIWESDYKQFIRNGGTNDEFCEKIRKQIDEDDEYIYNY